MQLVDMIKENILAAVQSSSSHSDFLNRFRPKMIPTCALNSSYYKDFSFVHAAILLFRRLKIDWQNIV